MLFTPVRWVIKLVSLALIVAVVYVVVCGVQVVISSRLSTAPSAIKPAMAIVVLGQPVANRSAGADLSARLKQAATLYADHRAGLVFVTGSAASLRVEWNLLRKTYHVAPSALKRVSAADASIALLETSKALMSGNSVIIVTDAIDALWAKYVGAQDGLSVQVSPPASSEKLIFSELGPLVRESTGVAVGRIFGFGHAPWAAY
ncbi:MAG TPA: ElyC/SanA/YdcF family protein [Acidimicrobiales bacterium]|nr:ElyC/SanA/YdcF family protein [Acidimicrobiales bacterium]